MSVTQELVSVSDVKIIGHCCGCGAVHDGVVQVGLSVHKGIVTLSIGIVDDQNEFHVLGKLPLNRLFVFPADVCCLEEEERE